MDHAMLWNVHLPWFVCGPLVKIRCIADTYIVFSFFYRTYLTYSAYKKRFFFTRGSNYNGVEMDLLIYIHTTGSICNIRQAVGIHSLRYSLYRTWGISTTCWIPVLCATSISLFNVFFTPVDLNESFEPPVTEINTFGGFISQCFFSQSTAQLTPSLLPIWAYCKQKATHHTPFKLKNSINLSRFNAARFSLY